MKLSIILSAAFLSLILLPSCAFGVDCEGSFTYNTDDFTPEQQEQIEHSAVRWNEFIGYEKVKVRPGTSRSSCSITKSHLVYPAIGFYHTEKKDLLIDTFKLAEKDRNTAKYVEAIVMHEIGHAIGLHHIGDAQTAIMSYIGGYEFTELDRIECRNAGVCPQ